MKRERFTLWLLVAGIALIALASHWSCVGLKLTNWDDFSYLQHAETNRLSWAGIQWAFTSTFIYYHPLTWLSHGLDAVLWGRNLAADHAHNVVLHTLNSGLVVLLAWLLAGWLKSWTVRERFLFAAWTGLVFAIHPLQVEPVAWLAGRKTLLAGFFCLISVIAYLRWAETPARRGWWSSMVLAYVAALLSKPMAVSLPVVLLALDYFPLRRNTTMGWRRLITEKWLLFLLGLALAAVTFIGQSNAGALRAVPVPLLDRLFVAARSFVFYLWKIIWPAWLSPFYPLGEGNNYWNLEYLFSLGVCLLVTGATIVMRKRRPPLVAAWGAYVAMILPISGLFQAGGQAVADRFAYLALLAVVLPAAGGLIWLCRRLPDWRQAGLWVLVAGYLAWFADRTKEQIPVWYDSATMWVEVVRRIQASTTEYSYAGNSLAADGHYAEAVPYARRAEELLTADDAESRRQVGELYRTLAVGFLKKRQFAECAALAERAVALIPDDFTSFAALGLAELKGRQYAVAAQHLGKALELQPKLSTARYNLGCAEAQLQRWPEAWADLQQASGEVPALAALLARDPALAEMRADPIYGPRLQALAAGAHN